MSNLVPRSNDSASLLLPPRTSRSSMASSSIPTSTKPQIGYKVVPLNAGSSHQVSPKSTLGIIASIGFLSFLWFGTDKNTTWRLIASEDWITKAVAMSSLVLRTSISSQAVIATSMLAGLALEKIGTLLPHLASISTIRNSNSGPLTLAWFLSSAPAIKIHDLRRSLLSCLTVLLLLISLLSQFSSTVLLSDIKSGLVPKFQVVGGISTNLQDGENSTTFTLSDITAWHRRPAAYASFAEFRPSQYTSGSGFTETGVSLRAFLPIVDQPTRVLTKDYAGSATVIDTRVACFLPNMTFASTNQFNIQLDAISLLATVGIPSSVVQEYNNIFGNDSRLVDYSSDFGPLGCPFTQTTIRCLVLSVNVLTLCQMPKGATGSFLIGQFQSNVNGSHYAKGFDEYANLNLIATNFSIPDLDSFVPATNWKLHHTTSEGEFLHVFFGNNSTPKSSMPRVSLSLCYNALMAVDVPARATTDSTCQELSPQMGDGFYNFTDFPEDVPSGSQAGIHNSDYIQSVTQGTEPTLILDLTTNTTVTTLTKVYPEYSILAREILSSGGSLVFTMQSLLTIIAGTAYYEQLPNFKNKTLVQRTNLVLAQIPAGKGTVYEPSAAGFQRGFVAVLVVTLVHVALMVAIISLFFLKTTISTLDNAWQTIAQIYDAATLEYITKASLASDSEVENWMKTDGNGTQIVGMSLSDNGHSTKLIGMRRRFDDKEGSFGQHSRTRSQSSDPPEGFI
ncbi:uncharacterized protein PAC_07588 [Phialocephala subalpina]|uniref:Uncharacterized protein n=1 Tax=Phialocephala subalpina TaxID=576137 RepID=A0A1L7WY61_9HELO|nr:uncharacterized protein PAC_07588 [Phialocephala subalpina]